MPMQTGKIIITDMVPQQVLVQVAKEIRSSRRMEHVNFTCRAIMLKITLLLVPTIPRGSIFWDQKPVLLSWIPF